jgi:hypothetical protein
VGGDETTTHGHGPDTAHTIGKAGRPLAQDCLAGLGDELLEQQADEQPPFVPDDGILLLFLAFAVTPFLDFVALALLFAVVVVAALLLLLRLFLFLSLCAGLPLLLFPALLGGRIIGGTGLRAEWRRGPVAVLLELLGLQGDGLRQVLVQLVQNSPQLLSLCMRRASHG